MVDSERPGAMPDYALLKSTHVACVALSYLGFFVRGVWMIRGSPLLGRRWVRIAPHVVDTLLLASALGLAVLLRQNPLIQPWLAAKIVALVLYIALGIIALGRGRTGAVRVTAWIAAQLVFLYIVTVALTRSPAPWN
jgi:uncharacterized membrane protein SirB2